MVELRFIKDKMLTKPGKEMAKERHTFMVKFFNRFLKEVEGKL
jgi:HD superfamily phosphodiesterase